MLNQQFHPVRDVGVAGVQTVNQVISTGINTANQLNAGVAGMLLSLFNTVPTPPPLPAPPTVGLPGFGQQKMNLTPTGVKEDDFDVVE